jgi:FtsZ-binding cell division protein ZapB
MSAFDEVIDEKSASAAGAGETPAVGTEAPAEPQTPSTTPDQSVEPQAATEGAREGEQGEAQTEDEINLTGLESPDELLKRDAHWESKTTRRMMPVIKQAGGFQNLKRGADLISAVQNPEVTGINLLSKIAEVSKSRAVEMRDNIWAETVRGYPDATLQAMFRDDEEIPLENLSHAFVRQAILNEMKFGAGSEVAEPVDDLSTLPDGLQKELAELRELKKQFPELQKEVSGFREERKTASEQLKDQQAQTLGQELYKSVFSVVDERKSKLGLDDKPTDSDRVKDIKADLRELLSPDRLEAAFMSNKDNEEMSDRAIAYVKRLEKDAAFSLRDTLAVAAEITFEDILREPRIARKVAELKSVMESESQPRNPTARDEIVAGTPAGFTPANVFDEAAKEGITNPFDAMQWKVKQARAAQ